MIKGKHPTLLKVTYVRPNRNYNQKECFQVIYSDDEGNVHYSEEPGEANIWITKPEYRNHTYNKPEERMERMDKIRVPISKIRYKIAEEAGDWGKALIKRSIDEHNFRILNQVYRWPYCYGADFQPEYYFMKDWYEKYELPTKPNLTKSFLDIETDLMDYTVDLEHIRDTAYAPINVIGVAFESTKEAFQFILRPYKPPRNGRSDEEYQERYKMYEKQLKAHNYLMSHLDEHYAKLHREFDSTYGHLDYHIREYEHEIDLIADFFRLINTRKPNFCEIWNMRFDIQYIYWRIIALGYDPKSIMCHPDIPNPVCYFQEDRFTYLIEKQFDFFHCTSYTQFICQMRTYSAIRKSQHKLRSVALNAIADRELKDKKVEYPENANIVRFPYEDWILFLIYNLKDFLLQLGIERKTKDLETYYNRSHANLTPYNKIFRETHLLRNVREMYFEREGWVQGNNLNTLKEDSDELANDFYGRQEEEKQEKASFKGAINAEPTMNMNIGEEVLGVKTNNIFHSSIDMDMGAFYPSIKIASNMDPATLKYKASFDNDEFISGEFSNKSQNQQYEERDKNNNLRKIDITGEAVNTYASGNILSFAYNFLNLPSIPDLYRQVKKMLTK